MTNRKQKAQKMGRVIGRTGAAAAAGHAQTPALVKKKGKNIAAVINGETMGCCIHVNTRKGDKTKKEERQREKKGEETKAGMRELAGSSDLHPTWRSWRRLRRVRPLGSFVPLR